MPRSVRVKTVTETDQRLQAAHRKIKVLRCVSLLLTVFTLVNFGLYCSSIELKSFVSVTGVWNANTQRLVDASNNSDNVRRDSTGNNNGTGNGAETRARTGTIPLPELTRAFETVTCAEGLFPVPMVVNPTADKGEGRRIPKIIHQTGEGKCMTQVFYDNVKLWHFEGHSFYFHDFHAKQTLLQKFWPEFPQLQNAYHCLKNSGGAAIADLWRYLALWEYGGIYTDMDNKPAKLFNASTIPPDMDGYFLQSAVGFPSQYFFGIAPKHPLMFLAVYDVMMGMLSLEEVGTFYVPPTTGPSCLQRSFIRFLGIRGDDKFCNAKCIECCRWPPAGHYVGLRNRSIDVHGSRTTTNDYIAASAINGPDKADGWKRMGYSNYHELNKIPKNKTCIEVIMEEHFGRLFPTDPVEHFRALRQELG